jgi:predicted phosphodiesterase
MSNGTNQRPLRFLHIGDLHITEAGLQNHLDLRRIADEVNANASGGIDFVILPGDNADDGTPEQFRIVHDEMSRLTAPWHAIPGDHDFKPRSLDNFYAGLKVGRLPSGCHCIFLDVVSCGSGGPDFRLGAPSLIWLREQINAARRDEKVAVVFMHTYPADLRGEADELTTLLDDSTVALVDMGHTHYNELTNDGRTIYAATCSTGQIEEGDVGFAFAAIDRGTVSWRFKTLESSWPFVMITAPADRRLVSQPDSPDQILGASCEVRASAWGAVPIAEAVFKIDDDDWRLMQGGHAEIFIAAAIVPDRSFRLTVRVTDHRGGQDTDTVEVARSRTPLIRKPTGSDAGSIGAWPERHLFGTQLGPNRNGRKW